MAKAKGPQRIEKTVELLRAWQALEREAVNTTAEIMETTDNALIRQIMEIIRNDSVQHHRVQQFVIDHLTRKPVQLQPADDWPRSGAGSRPTTRSSGRRSSSPRSSRDVHRPGGAHHPRLPDRGRAEARHDPRPARGAQAAHVEAVLTRSRDRPREGVRSAMGLLKKKDKPTGGMGARLSGGGGSGSQISPLRPVFTEKLPPCTGNLPERQRHPRVAHDHRSAGEARPDPRRGVRQGLAPGGRRPTRSRPSWAGSAPTRARGTATARTRTGRSASTPSSASSATTASSTASATRCSRARGRRTRRSR